MMKLAFTILVALAIGFLAGQLTGDTSAPVRTITVEKAARCASPAATARLTPADVALLKRELASVVTAGTSAPGSRDPSEALETESESESESEENIAASARARAVFDQAFRAGVWTDGHAADLRALMGQVSPAVERELLGALVAALNEQRLALATSGPPL
jgi:hypothetical protein